MNPLYDLDDEKKDELIKVEDKAGRIDERLKYTCGLGTNLEDRMGMCSSCEHFDYVEDDMHAIIKAQCSGFNWDNPDQLSGRHKIKRCSQYKRKGTMSINEMYKIATLIEPGEFTTKRKKAGFTSEEIKQTNERRKDK